MKAHLIFYVQDQKKSTSFYASVLNKTPILDVPGMSEFLLSDSCVLGLMPESGIKKLLGEKLPDPVEARGIPRAELYLVVDDARQYHTRALSAGARCISEMALRDWGQEVSYCLDPDDHVIAFAQA